MPLAEFLHYCDPLKLLVGPNGKRPDYLLEVAGSSVCLGACRSLPPVWAVFSLPSGDLHMLVSHSSTQLRDLSPEHQPECSKLGSKGASPTLLTCSYSKQKALLRPQVTTTPTWSTT